MLEVNCFLQWSFLKLTCLENIVLLSPQSLNEEEEKTSKQDSTLTAMRKISTT